MGVNKTAKNFGVGDLMKLRSLLVLALACAFVGKALAEDWEYVKSIPIPRPYAPTFAATTPSGDCVVATFNNSKTEKPVELPVILIHKPLSDTPGFYVVCTNEFSAFRGYSGIAVDSEGNFYVAADTGGADSWIRKFTPDGKRHPSFGNNGEIRPNRRVLGLDLAGDYLFATFGFGELAKYSAKTGALVGTVPAPAKDAPLIRDIAVDPTRQIIYGVALGAAWAWKGGRFDNISGYKLTRISEDALKNPKAGEGIFYDAFGDRVLLPVSELATLFAVSPSGQISKSEIKGGEGLVRSPCDAVLLADGKTLFIPDMIAGPTGECNIHVMRRVGASTEAPTGAIALPSLADAGLLKPSAPAPAPSSSQGAGTAKAAPAPAGKITWRSNFAATLDEARQSGKPVLLYARTDVARRCGELEADFLKSDAFASAASKYLLVWFDVTSDPKLAQQLGIFKVPFIAIYRPDGERAEMWSGRIDTAEVLAKMGAHAK